jgi:hypothetical protein
MSFLKIDNIDNYIQESALDNKCNININTESYFNTALVVIAECNNDYREAYKQFQTSILENNGSILNSLYNEFVGQVSNIIDKFNKCMKDNHSNYISSLKRQMANDKITLDKDKLVSIKVSGIYNYTIEDNVPKDTISRDIYFEEIDKLQKILKNNNSSQEQKSINMMYVYTELMEDLRGTFYDRFRGEILGLKKEITAIEYADELFRIFRDNGVKVGKVIDKNELLAIEKRFKDMKNYISNTERQKNDIIKEYTRIKKDISNIKLADVANMIGSNAEEIDERLQRYIRSKTEQVLNMCSIHTMAYTAKLDAIASMYLQDRNILNSAVAKYTVAEDDNVEVGEEQWYL